MSFARISKAQQSPRAATADQGRCTQTTTSNIEAGGASSSDEDSEDDLGEFFDDVGEDSDLSCDAYTKKSSVAASARRVALDTGHKGLMPGVNA